MTTKLSRNARTLMQSYGDDGSSGEALRVIDSLTEEVRDLKVRLKAARLALDWADCEHGAGYCEVPTCNVCRGYRATDLRVKNWRKP